MHTLNKKLVFISIIIFFVLFLAIIISPITKYLIQKYDEKYTGRQITMDWVFVNPFNGYVHFSNLKFYEYKSDTVFISIAGLSANFNLFKLFFKTVKISSITCDEPYIRIIQRKDDFNFDDLRIKSHPEWSSPKPKKPFHFYILNVEINQGHFYYVDEVTPVKFSIKDVNIASKDGWCWNKDTISAHFSFLSEPGTGGMKGNYAMNIKTLFYSLEISVNTFDLNILEQYMKNMTNYGSFRANFDADIKANGRFKEVENINLQGKLAINDFHVGKNPGEDYAAFGKVMFTMEDMNPMEGRYYIDSVLVFYPYFRYDRYDNQTDNLQEMFGKSGSNVIAAISDEEQFNLIFVIGKYIKKLAKNFFRSDFKINHLAIYNGYVKFNDYTLNEKFALEFDTVNVKADSIEKQHNRVNISLKSLIKPYGNLSVFLSINPKDTGDFDLKYHIHNVPVSIFNSYLITYTSFPLDRGTIELNGAWTVRNSEINSVNHIVIIDPRLSKRLKNDDSKWLPMPLVMSLVRERSNIIDYEIPITGSFKDPAFHVGDVLLDLLTNIFVKPPSTPYLHTVKNAENEIEKSITMKWNMRQGSILPYQEKFIEKMGSFLKKNPKATITVYPVLYAEKEKEYILFYESKKKFFLMNNHITAKAFDEEDSISVDKMSIRDAVFLKYLKKQANDSMLFTIQEQCAALMDSSFINAELSRLAKQRKASFLSYFKDKKVENEVRFSASESVIPYNGFSYYKIKYTGELPESLLKAYRKMNDLNDDPLREKYKAGRQESSVEK